MRTRVEGRAKLLHDRNRVVVATALGLVGILAGGPLYGGSELDQEVRLTGDPVPATHYYRMTTEVVPIDPDGKRKSPNVYDLWVEYAPRPRGDGDLVTCRRFTVRASESPEVVLPSLAGWSYVLRRTESGLDDRGWIFGIDQTKFENLADDKGNVLPLDVTYAVFNAFVDVHSIAQVFAARATSGGGIQDLRAIGQKIRHAAAHTRAPVSLGTMVEKGSYFENREVTLELKGLSRVDGRRCALIGFDSGDSNLHMVLEPAPQVALEVNGGSHYFGDIYVDLESQWVRKATLGECVVSETSGAVLPQKIQSVVERRILLRDLSEDEFERDR